MKKWIISILVLGTSMAVQAQHLVPLHRYRTQQINLLMNSDSTNYHTALKPYVISDTGRLFKGLYERNGSGLNWVMRKLRYENLVLMEEKNYRFTADPVLHFELSKNQDVDEYFYRNTRGFLITGRIGKKVAFHSILYENQVAFQPYVTEMIQNNEVIPHAAKYKLYEIPLSQFHPNGYDFSMTEGVFSWNALPQLNFQFGQGKHFIGDGHRSLLLSDNSYSYPYFQGTINIGPFQYTSLFAEMMDFDLPNSPESGYRKKRFQMHYLNWIATKWLQLGLFELVIYHPEDSIGFKGFKPNYINPLILSRTVEYGFDGKNNVLLGLNGKITLPAGINIYGQYILDAMAEPDSDFVTDQDAKYGFQIGLKWFDILGIHNLFGLAEMNRVSAFTYGHQQSPQNYSHARQALAHPMGAGFDEFVGRLTYQLKDFEIDIQGNFAQYDLDTTMNISGRDIFTSYEITNQLTEGKEGGIDTRFAYGHVQLSYLLNPSTDLRIYTGAAVRKEAGDIADNEDIWVFFGLRTFLSNQLFDF